MTAFYDLGVTSVADPAGSPAPSAKQELLLHGRWKQLIPREQWQVFQRVIRKARARRIDFAFGGAFAVAIYTGKWRETKDMDLYIRPCDRDEMIAALADAGLNDYFPVKDYDRSWIYRSYTGDVIVDAIWSMANHRTDVDEAWLTLGPAVQFGGELVRVAPPEELIWSKLYVLQRDRSDWPDVLNLIYAVGAAIDWERLLDRLGDDALLLEGVLAVFRWLDPNRAAALPSWLSRLSKRRPLSDPTDPCERVRLLDSRPWFRPFEEDPEARGEPKRNGNGHKTPNACRSVWPRKTGEARRAVEEEAKC